mmetsp:Transcript_37498/g.108327  ORF Transcript_37498/g.108327 Transcript_37498/m.108327 type:complete len:234 (-) Transcript_37498:169-870(-)
MSSTWPGSLWCSTLRRICWRAWTPSWTTTSWRWSRFATTTSRQCRVSSASVSSRCSSFWVTATRRRPMCARSGSRSGASSRRGTRRGRRSSWRAGLSGRSTTSRTRAPRPSNTSRCGRSGDRRSSTRRRSSAGRLRSPSVPSASPTAGGSAAPRTSCLSRPSGTSATRRIAGGGPWSCGRTSTPRSAARSPSSSSTPRRSCCWRSSGPPWFLPSRRISGSGARRRQGHPRRSS